MVKKKIELSERIDSIEFIGICREAGAKMSQPTLSRRLEDENFLAAVGAKKEMTATSKIPAWTFDRKLSEAFAQNPDGYKKPEKKESTALVRSARSLPAVVERPARTQETQMDVALLPFKKLLTIDEARKLSGCPLWYVQKWKKKIHGRNYIDAGNIEKMVKNFLMLEKK